MIADQLQELNHQTRQQQQLNLHLKLVSDKTLQASIVLREEVSSCP